MTCSLRSSLILRAYGRRPGRVPLVCCQQTPLDRPAVTCDEFGDGRAWYVSCDLGTDIEKVLGAAVRPAVMWPLLASTLAFNGIEVVCRSSESHRYQASSS